MKDQHLIKAFLYFRQLYKSINKLIQFQFTPQNRTIQEMGQSQQNNAITDYQAYPEIKPQQISYLQILIDNMSYTAIDPLKNLSQSKEQSQSYGLYLQSHQSKHYKYGIKLKSQQKQKQIPSTTSNFQKLNSVVQIYLISQKQKQPDALIFEGQLKKGKRNNYGIEYDRKGDVFYQGFFKDNKYHGWGFSSNYKGQWSKGMKNGYGVYDGQNLKFNNQKLYYEGLWKQDRFHGLGGRNIKINETQLYLHPEYQANQNDIDYQYIGEWNQGAKWGCGKCVKYLKKGENVQDTQIYEGQFMFNNYSGKGKIKKDLEKQFIIGTFQKGEPVKL